MALNDAVFLIIERREQPMHVGGLQLFHYPPGAGESWLEDVYESVVRSGPGQIAPLFRRRPHRSVTTLGAWSWELDPDVDLEFHVRHSALPRPGRVRELLALVSRLHGVLLDRSRPLWELHLIEGLEGDRFAVYSKIHHSVLDGVSALRLLQRSLSPDPEARGLPLAFAAPPAEGPQGPSPEGADGAGAADGGPGVLDVPAAVLRTVYDVAELAPIAAQAAIRDLLDPNAHLPLIAPRTILNQPITAARRFAAQAWDIERLRRVARVAGATINDVLLAMCSGALRAYLSEMGALPNRSLVAMTPVSLRREGTAAGGNAVGALLCNLATEQPDPAARLAAVQESMRAGKATFSRFTPTQAIVASAAVVSPVVLSQIPGVRRVASPGYNIVISNIPGPTEALYWNGAELEGVYPLSLLTDGQALNVTVTSYHGHLEFGLTGCRQTVPHLQRLLPQLEDSLADLEKAVAA